MNQQIKELHDKARQFYLQDEYLDLPAKQLHTLIEEKFAELIVQECMWKIMTRKEEAIDNDWDVDEAMSAAISDISEHFGVKE